MKPSQYPTLFRQNWRKLSHTKFDVKRQDVVWRWVTVNPKAWIEDVLNKIKHMKPSQYHTLFPLNWRK